MSDLADLLANNAEYVEAVAGRPELPPAPRLKLAIVTCMDARVEPLRALGLDLGDAHVIRNGGGRASDDVFRSLALGRAMLGITTVLVIHHTKCRLRGHDAASLREALANAGGEVPPAFDLLPLPDDIETGVRTDVERIRSAPMIPPGLTVHGLIYDVDSGGLRVVPAAEVPANAVG
jgi:carbonic anhydrase